MKIIHIGCNNGKDHVLDFCIKNKNMIEEIHLIEPNEYELEICKQTYSGFPQARFHNLAIVPDEKKSVELHIPQQKSFSGHASTSTAHLIAHGHNGFDSIRVMATNLNEFFESNKISICDRLYIDTEGLDCEIILNLDIEKYKIGRIEFEIIHTDGVFSRGQKYINCIEKLKNLGYIQDDAGQYNEAYQKC